MSRPGQRSRGALLGAALCAAALAACAHGESGASKQTQTAPEQTKSEPAQAPAKPKAGGESSGRSLATLRIEDFMADHFLIATFSRDAIINGDLESLREPLSALAQHDYAEVAPGGWMPWIAQIQEAANVTAQAQRLDAAASGVAAIARVCGGCHEAQGGGPRYVQANESDAQTGSRTLPDRMYRHMWAADRLWEGITGPSDRAWSAGAQALARVTAEPAPENAPLPPELVAGLAELRGLGLQAQEATSLEQRANVYGLLIATCAGCHARGVAYEF